MELGCRVSRHERHDVRWQNPVEPADDPDAVDLTRSRETDHLLAGVYSRVGPTGDNGLDRNLEHDLQSGFQLGLYRTNVGLACIPAKVRTVVGNVKTSHSRPRVQEPVQFGDRSGDAHISRILAEPVERNPSGVGHAVEYRQVIGFALKREANVEVKVLGV